MIKSFRCKGTEKLFQRQFVSRFPSEIRRNALRKLLLLDAAERLEDLKMPPGNRLEKLSGDRQGHALMINGEYVFVGIKGMLMM